MAVRSGNVPPGGVLMSMWKRTMEYLGLGPDDAYEDDNEYDKET